MQAVRIIAFGVAIAAAVVLPPAWAQTPDAPQAPGDHPASSPPSSPDPTAPPRPWVFGDPAPTFEGVRLGDSRDQVIEALGEPDPIPPGLADPNADLQPMPYRGGALMIGVSKTDGVVRILLRKPEAGVLAGVRVGDRLGKLVRLWGEPTAGGGSVGRYPMGDWVVSVRGDMMANTVLTLMLARPKPPATPGATSPAPAAPPATPAPASR